MPEYPRPYQSTAAKLGRDWTELEEPSQRQRIGLHLMIYASIEKRTWTRYSRALLPESKYKYKELIGVTAVRVPLGVYR